MAVQLKFASMNELGSGLIQVTPLTLECSQHI